MTMQAMVDRLKEAGFEVEKSYDKLAKGYRFIISKGDRHTSALFEYPADTSKAYCDQKQREFIDYIIGMWLEHHVRKASESIYSVNHKTVADMYPRMIFKDGRGNGKSLACAEYTKKLIESGYLSNDEIAVIRKDGDYTAQEKENSMKIKTVHFNKPMTIVIWEDGTKTIVKAREGDPYDPEKGLAMAIAKKAMGNKYSYIDEIKKWVSKRVGDATCQQ